MVSGEERLQRARHDSQMTWCLALGGWQFPGVPSVLIRCTGFGLALAVDRRAARGDLKFARSSETAFSVFLPNPY